MHLLLKALNRRGKETCLGSNSSSSALARKESAHITFVTSMKCSQMSNIEQARHGPLKLRTRYENSRVPLESYYGTVVSLL
jgi:hypothetical protein